MKKDDGILARDMRDMRIEAMALSTIAKLEGQIRKEEKFKNENPVDLLNSIKKSVTTPTLGKKYDDESLLNQMYMEEKSDKEIKLVLKKNNFNK